MDSLRVYLDFCSQQQSALEKLSELELNNEAFRQVNCLDHFMRYSVIKIALCENTSDIYRFIANAALMRTAWI